MILTRYINKEMIKTTLAVSCIAMLVFMSNLFVKYLSSAAQGKLAGSVLLQVMLLEVPHLLGILLPFGLFLGILVTFGRLYAESEMVVMRASGVSQLQLLHWCRFTIGLFLLIVLLLNFWITPNAIRYRDRLLTQTGVKSLVQTVIPGRFQVINGGRMVMYVSSLSRDRARMQHVFLAQQVDNTTQPNRYSIVAANSGQQRIDKHSGDSYIEVNDGHRYTGTAGAADYQVMQFKRYGLRITGSNSADTNPDESTFSTPKLIALWPLHIPHYLAELQWRAAMPISLVLLAIIAVPLSRLKPRSGRYAKILPALFLYIIYANLMFVARSWVQNAEVSVGVGMWWVQYCLLAVAIVIWLPSLWQDQWRGLAKPWRRPST